MSEESGQEFTVVDKRRRGDVEEPAPTPQPPSSSRVRREASAPAPARPAEAELPSEPDLATLFFMLASSALVNLGMSPDPGTGAANRDLTQARLSIDLLRVLKEKTEGNRSTEESALLEDLLYDLQIRFVQAAQGRA